MNDTDRIREELLVLRCQLGEADAFRDLLNLMEPRLIYFLRRLLRNEQTSYDLLQEVWLTVFQRIQRLRDPKSFRSWIYRIAHDKAVTHIRHEVSRERAEGNYQDKMFLQSEKLPWSADTAAEIHLLLDKLSAVHREVLTLFFLEEMKYDEIADVIQCGVGTVKSRLFYAKEALRRLLKEQQSVTQPK